MRKALILRASLNVGDSCRGVCLINGMSAEDENLSKHTDCCTLTMFNADCELSLDLASLAHYRYTLLQRNAVMEVAHVHEGSAVMNP